MIVDIEHLVCPECGEVQTLMKPPTSEFPDVVTFSCPKTGEIVKVEVPKSSNEADRSTHATI